MVILGQKTSHLWSGVLKTFYKRKKGELWMRHQNKFDGVSWLEFHFGLGLIINRTVTRQ